jgi:hypothetical protein
VTYAGTLRRAVRAALQVPGVLSVRSSVELEGALYGGTDPARYTLEERTHASAGVMIGAGQ